MVDGRVRHRPRISFRSVNQPGSPEFQAGLQRHHLLPRQIRSQPALRNMLCAVGGDHLNLEDFRENGLLLPATARAALRMGLPLHRGPHHTYNALVAERVGQIEAHWAVVRLRNPDQARWQALERLRWLQRALRRRLLAQHRRLRLNRSDPLGAGVDFAELDAMAAALWSATDGIAGSG